MRTWSLSRGLRHSAWYCSMFLVACGSKDADKSATTGGPSTTKDGGASILDAGHDAAPVGFGKCSGAPPIGATLAPDPKPYTGGTCPTLTTGADTESTITSSGVERKFMVIVPDDMTPDQKLPLVFLWHWLNASAHSFYDRAFVKDAVNQQHFIAVLPESIGTTPCDWRGWITINPQSQEEEEFVFFDDMLSCVSAQFPVNKNCVSSAGVSDGALWTSQLLGGRADYLSSAIVLSGGVGGPDFPAGSIDSVIRDFIPATSAHRLPAIVLWGGPNDNFILNFEPATKALEKRLQDEGHFIVECQHNCGHDEPPFTPPPGESKFAAFWDFVDDHPYWLDPGTSPYQTAGKLPSTFPDWCGIGVGSAREREGGGCANLIGQALGGGGNDGG
jgi:hypothetical protein